MKVHYRLFFFTLVLLSGLNVLAQTTPFTFGIKAGVNMSNATIDNKDADPKLKIGYQVGATVDYTLTQEWLIQSGLSFTAKGSKIDDFDAGRTIGGDGRGTTHTFNELYIQMPLYAAYKVNVSENFGIVIGAGPYMAYGIGGKTKKKLHKAVFGDGSTEREFDTFGNAKDAIEQLKRFDLGLGLNVSAEFGKIVVGLGYEHGLLNVAAYDGMKYRNRNATLTLGYKL